MPVFFIFYSYEFFSKDHGIIGSCFEAVVFGVGCFQALLVSRFLSRAR